jgi:hypothetical protein
MPKSSHPLAVKKAIKPDIQPDLGDYQFPVPLYASQAAFPFAALQIKLWFLPFYFLPLISI